MIYLGSAVTIQEWLMEIIKSRPFLFFEFVSISLSYFRLELVDLECISIIKKEIKNNFLLVLFYVCYKSLLATKIIIDSGRFLDKFSGKVALM